MDIAARSTVDLTSIGQSDLGCAEALIESGMDPTGVTQTEMGFTVLESYNQNQDFRPRITEVIQPMEMAELVDILPTLSLIEEEAISSPAGPSVLDMLESFGLGMTDSNKLIQLEKPDLSREAMCLPPSEANYSSRGMKSQAPASSARHATVNCTVNAMGNEVLNLSFEGSREDREAEQASNIRLPVRNRVEWDSPSTSQS